jgi:hypothetical protein
MRVCLINPPRIQPKAWGKPNVFPPISLASVAAVLEKKHDVCNKILRAIRNPKKTVKLLLKRK